MLRCFVPSPRCADKPFDGFGRILRHTASSLVAQAEIALRWRAFLIRSRQIPFYCLLKILGNNMALLVKHAKVELRRRITAAG